MMDAGAGACDAATVSEARAGAFQCRFGVDDLASAAPVRAGSVRVR